MDVLKGYLTKTFEMQISFNGFIRRVKNSTDTDEQFISLSYEIMSETILDVVISKVREAVENKHLNTDIVERNSVLISKLITEYKEKYYNVSNVEEFTLKLQELETLVDDLHMLTRLAIDENYRYDNLRALYTLKNIQEGDTLEHVSEVMINVIKELKHLKPWFSEGLVKEFSQNMDNTNIINEIDDAVESTIKVFLETNHTTSQRVYTSQLEHLLIEYLANNEDSEIDSVVEGGNYLYFAIICATYSEYFNDELYELLSKQDISYEDMTEDIKQMIEDIKY